MRCRGGLWAPLIMCLVALGTDLSKTNQAKDESYAKSQGLTVYKYVLHPRTKGFTHLMSCLGDSVDFVDDIT